MTEERNGEIEFRVVNNDNARESLIILTGLKCIFQKQLPKMPKDYIARLVYDRTHLSMAIVKKPLEVVGCVMTEQDIEVSSNSYTEVLRIARSMAASSPRLSSALFPQISK